MSRRIRSLLTMRYSSSSGSPGSAAKEVRWHRGQRLAVRVGGVDLQVIAAGASSRTISLVSLPSGPFVSGYISLRKSAAISGEKMSPWASVGSGCADSGGEGVLRCFDQLLIGRRLGWWRLAFELLLQRDVCRYALVEIREDLGLRVDRWRRAPDPQASVEQLSINRATERISFMCLPPSSDHNACRSGCVTTGASEAKRWQVAAVGPRDKPREDDLAAEKPQDLS